ncbi:uroporphyrinogen-III synthase [Terriglobus roseus]|uniref:Uroporphyrinogen-III synthase n=1 Tax=Terriglobus roseus TaxID=392734 RepID=A0A1G7JFG5_9BACT|nr:uroporphyrinogen-III synthase [Terriglobus roseus]SDF23651.1 uroporphyrinogen-III synthase [Terriglobus roseus]
MRHASFDGLRVLSLETRRAREVEKLIRTYNGDPIVVSAMREIPLESNTDCFAFGERLLNGDFDLLIFLTGIGVTKLLQTLETRYSQGAILEQFRKREVVTRGVKPVAVLRELQVPVSASTEEPSTWHEVLALLDSQYGQQLGGFRVAVQEYGATNPEFIAELVGRCAEVTKVPVYQWGLPLDLEPLRDAVRRLCDGEIDVVLFMTAVQVIHLFQIADELGLREMLSIALQQAMVVSIGPTTTEELKHYGVQPDFEPSRPRMGFMVNEAAQYAKKLLAEKRSVQTSSIAAPNVRPRPPYRGSVQQVAPSTSAMSGFRDGLAPFDVLQEISSHIASTDPLHVTLSRIVTLVSIVIPCDSCFLYTLEDDKLVLRASRNPHTEELDHLNLSIGEGVTGWVAEHRETVAIPERASEDPRFSAFVSLPEDRFEAMLCAPVSCANRVVGVLNVQHRQPYQHSELEQRMLSTVGILVGAEIERARLETENSVLTNRLETRKLVDRAKGILQRDLNLFEDDAYRNMQRESRQRRKSMREIAEAILLADSLRRDKNV